VGNLSMVFENFPLSVIEKFPPRGYSLAACLDSNPALSFSLSR